MVLRPNDDDRSWPDITDEETSPVLCPECYRPTHYALNTDRYVCAQHGPALTAERLYSPRGRN